jgi:cell cycle sensor histidine kinase DivJ
MWLLGFEAWMQGRSGEASSAHAGAAVSIVLSRIVAAAWLMAAVPLFLLVERGHELLLVAMCLHAVLPLVVVLELRRPEASAPRALLLASATAAALLVAMAFQGISPWVMVSAAAVAVLEAVLCGRRAERASRPMEADSPAGLWLVRLVSGIWLAAAMAAFAGWQMVGQGLAAPGWCHAALVLAALSQLAVLGWGLRNREQAGRAEASAAAGRADLLGEVISDVVVLVNPRIGVASVTPNVERIFGHRPADVLGRGLLDLVLVSDRPAMMQAFQDAADGLHVGPLRCRLRDGAVPASQPQFRWVELEARPHAAPGSSVVALLRDASVAVATEQRSAEAEEAARQARATQAAFLSTVNHELRTPLNAIIGFSDLLATPGLPLEAAATQEYARLINGAGYDLLRMVTAMIDLTRLDAGILESRCEGVAPRLLLESAVEAARAEGGLDGQPLTLSVETDVAEVVTDARFVRRILAQLIGNAARFGGGQPIHVSVRRQRAGLRFTVKDRGPGMAPEQLRRLGEAFAGADAALDRPAGGLGLGLALCRRLALLLHGTLSVDSREGEGSEVHLDLPLQPPVGASTMVALDSYRSGAATQREMRRRA